MEEETKTEIFDKIENNLLDFNRGSEELLLHSEVYLILESIKRSVAKNEIIKEHERKWAEGWTKK